MPKEKTHINITLSLSATYPVLIYFFFMKHCMKSFFGNKVVVVDSGKSTTTGHLIYMDVESNNMRNTA